MRDDAVLGRALPLDRGLGQNCYINNARPDETSILELSAEGYPIRKI